MVIDATLIKCFSDLQTDVRMWPGASATVPNSHKIRDFSAREMCVCMHVCVCVSVIMRHIIKFLPNSATRVLEKDCAKFALDKIFNLDACV